MSDSITRQAKGLLQKIGESDAWADDVLLFFYRLRDQYHKGTGQGAYLRGATFDSLNPIIYDLESRPDDVTANASEKALIEGILADLVSGKIAVQPKR